jgi:membrane-anchored protein YejM (alkaline phosphatase superfamily)
MTFARVTSAGSQTSVALSTLFSGRYFSQLEWTSHGVGAMRFLYPAADGFPRFPELLAAKGVRTASFCSLNFLAGEYGVLRGFSEESIIPGGREHAHARQVIDPLLERLGRAGPEPLFAYAHMMEPHAPYDRGARKGSNRDRYESEIAVSDAEIGRVMKLLLQRFPDRAVLIVSSDHGEAFGEHGTFYHTKTVYEELLRVPLFIMGHRIAARRVDRHVGLVDLGPTILDVFGVETPGGFMGQSLVPLLAGMDKQLDRPILAEGRLRRALYMDSGLKIIEDARRKTVEAYDLSGDPDELKNLFDTDRDRVLPGLIALRRFFALHSLSKPGYETPYKP